jgi:peptidoglycan/LPS O-acetylase OafA/YrhL
LWLIFQPAIAFANHFWNFRINISAPLATGFLCYFILGYLLGEQKLTGVWIITSLIIWLLATSITIIGTSILSHNADQFDPFFYDFITFNVIFASAAAFILLKWLAQSKEFTSFQVNTAIRRLATRTFGIYLIHILVLEALSLWMPTFHINSFIGNAIWSVPLVGTLVFLLSLIIIAALQKIPIIQQIVP